MPHKNSKLEASSRAAKKGRPSFCLDLTGNRGLGRRRGVWTNREGGKNSQSMGVGPKGNTGSRCGNTLYTLTHTSKEHNGQLEVTRVIKKLSWRVVIGWFVTPVNTTQTKDINMFTRRKWDTLSHCKKKSFYILGLLWFAVGLERPSRALVPDCQEMSTNPQNCNRISPHFIPPQDLPPLCDILNFNLMHSGCRVYNESFFFF